MKYLLKLFFILILNVSLYAQPTIEWWKSLGDSMYAFDYCYGACLAHDGGFLLTGNTQDYLEGMNHGLNDFWVVKLSDTGGVQWNKCYGGSGNEIARSILPTADGGYIMGGGTYNSNDGDLSDNPYTNAICGWIVKIDGIGNLEWQKCVCDTPNRVEFFEVQPTADSGYIAAGYITNLLYVNNNYYLDYKALITKFSSNGEIKWQREFGGSDKEIARHIEPTRDGGYIAVGYTYSNDGDLGCNYGDVDVWILKLDSLGYIQWQQCIGGTWEDSPYWITQTSDGGYIVCGNTLSSDGDFPLHYGVYDAFLAKLSPSGNIEWLKTYGGSFDDAFISIIQSQDGNFIAAGYSESNDNDVHGNHGAYDVWLVKTDTTGNIIWSKCYGTVDLDWATVVKQTSNNGFFIAGTHQFRVPDSYYTDMFDYYCHFYALKLSPEVGIAENTLMPIETLCYPNPAISEVHVRIRGELYGKYTVTLYNMQGNPIQQITTSDPKTTLNISQLPQGVYMIRVLGNNMARSEKVVKSQK